MYTHELRLTDYRRNPIREFNVTINAAHVTIKERGAKDMIYSRTDRPNGLCEEWWDEGHRKIANAIRELENALLDVIEERGERHKEE